MNGDGFNIMFCGKILLVFLIGVKRVAPYSIAEAPFRREVPPPPPQRNLILQSVSVITGQIRKL